MALLSVNVNKIATLRNSRGGNVPSVTGCASDLLDFGADGITVHPRPDGRHIRSHDVFDLKVMLQKRSSPPELNVEGYPSPEFIKLIEETRPAQCTLVPDPPEAITSNAGWAIEANLDFLKIVTSQIQKTGARVSLFIDVFKWNERETAALLKTGAERVELYTEAYAEAYQAGRIDESARPYSRIAKELASHGFAINAGHDLNLKNIRHLLEHVSEIEEVSIGHALIAEALYLGFKETIRQYKEQMT